MLHDVEKLTNALLLWVVQNLIGPTIGGNLAAVHKEHTTGHTACKADLMGYHQHLSLIHI